MRHNSRWGKEGYWIGRECGAKRALEPLRFFFLSVPNGGASSSQMLRSAFGVNFSWFAQINSALLLPQKQNQRLLRSQYSRAHPIWGSLSSKVKAFFCYDHHARVLRQERTRQVTTYIIPLSSTNWFMFKSTSTSTPPLSFAKQSLPPFRADKYSWYIKVFPNWIWLWGLVKKKWYFFRKSN